MTDQGKGRARRRDQAPRQTRPGYARLRHPFAPQPGFSGDEIAAMHDTALRILEDLGMRILLPEARAILRAGGAIVDDDSEMVRIGRDLVAEALRTAPRSIRLRAADPAHEQMFEPGAMLFMGGAGCPNVADRLRGRRPGSRESYIETLRLQQAFDVIHMLGPAAEAQDVPVHLRHYTIVGEQLTNTTKPLHIAARGQRQVLESFEMIRTGLALDEGAFTDGVWASTVINTNSPRLLDIPMARGVIDFAREGQLAIITPFCLAGAMAPVTVAGALVLQHAEALACIALSQMAAPGAPVAYGGFSSNVDMRSGAPAFGTPEHVRANLGSGQLARLIGLPWRSATGTTSKLADAQGAFETGMGLWSAVLAQATVTVHAAGWLEGGLTFGYEKFITDLEALRSLAELARPAPADAAALAYDAIAGVAPFGHFLGHAHTMERYRTAFYEPLNADLSNHGAWVEAGSLSAEERATGIWKATLDRFVPPPAAAEIRDRLAPWIAARTAAGGAPVEG